MVSPDNLGHRSNTDSRATISCSQPSDGGLGQMVRRLPGRPAGQHFEMVHNKVGKKKSTYTTPNKVSPLMLDA